jgi:hypothetical protein
MCFVRIWEETAIISLHFINPLTLELNSYAQRCLPRFFTEDFNFEKAHCVTSL